MKRIHRRPSSPVPAAIVDGFPPLLARLYAARHVTNPAELNVSLSGLLPYDSLHGMDGALDILQEAIVERKRILIVGDFDADGATSTACHGSGPR
jgi:single-stranded-DNA-specific exonuclease